VGEYRDVLRGGVGRGGGEMDRKPPVSHFRRCELYIHVYNEQCTLQRGQVMCQVSVFRKKHTTCRAGAKSACIHVKRSCCRFDSRRCSVGSALIQKLNMCGTRSGTCLVESECSVMGRARTRLIHFHQWVSQEDSALTVQGACIGRYTENIMLFRACVGQFMDNTVSVPL
jgi:hypothetical protein